MGLSASQARLLTLTARQHSVEGEAQRLMAGKLRLSNDSDRVYQKYLNALDEVTLKTRQTNGVTGDDCWIDGSINNLLRYNASEDTSGTVFYVQNMQDGTLYMPADICNAYDSATDEYNFAEKFGVKYDAVDRNKNIVMDYEDALKAGWNTLLGPTEDDANTILTGYEIALENDRNKKMLASLMLVDIPTVNTNGLYLAQTYNDRQVESFLNVMSKVISSPLYQTSYTANEKSVIEAAYEMVSGAADTSYPPETVESEDSSYLLNGFVNVDTTKVTTVNYLYNTNKVTKDGKDYAIEKGSKFSDRDIFDMALNGGTRVLDATKQTVVQHIYKDQVIHCDITTDSYSKTDNVYNFTVVQGRTAASILSSYNSSVNSYGKALRDIFTRVSEEDTFKDLFLSANGITEQDIANYRKYTVRRDDYESYIPMIEMVPDNKVASEYYIQIYNAIKAAGGHTKVSDKVAQSASWVTNMVKSSQVILGTWDPETEMISKTADSLHYNLREIADNNAIEVAGQKYEDELAAINAKDARFDTRLEQLDAEREAISTEIQSLKKIANENVESTFKLYS